MSKRWTDLTFHEINLERNNVVCCNVDGMEMMRWPLVYLMIINLSSHINTQRDDTALVFQSRWENTLFPWGNDLYLYETRHHSTEIWGDSLDLLVIRLTRLLLTLSYRADFMRDETSPALRQHMLHTSQLYSSVITLTVGTLQYNHNPRAPTTSYFSNSIATNV